MEHWGLVTFREVNLLYERGVSSTVNKMRVAMVIGHELAHMWFGNLSKLELKFLYEDYKFWEQLMICFSFMRPVGNIKQYFTLVNIPIMLRLLNITPSCNL
jgi:hypothetical protein